MKIPYIAFLLLSTASPVTYSVQEGQAAPACSTPLSASQAGLKPEAYLGKVVLIDFWATWCGPCQKSMPFFNHLRNERLKDGFEIVAVNVDEEAETAREFLQSHPVDYPVVFDPAGECPKAYQVKAMPSSYLLDKSGKVRYVHLGYRDSDQASLREQIQALLAE